MNPEEVCADCCAPAPTWASINRGVLICDECCSVHRSLGRHISYVRSLRANNWPPVLREMVNVLVKKGANTVWEHALHDPHTKVKVKKPSPKDKLQPIKHDFIVMKYKHLMLLSKANSKDNPNLVQELSKQLHASVRTANLDTCLRILSLGADPNFFHPERGNTPLHVAAQAGQAMQVELLVVYGANPTTLDRLGHTSEECARIAGHHELADRLIECQYELTDKLSYFLCGRKPSHSTGEHFLMPSANTTNSPGLIEARNRLQELNNQLLEELAADVYDEVDRRECDAVWLSTQPNTSAVPFLPVNPKLSPLRNQGRQKLGILDTQEFSQLLTDILIDTKRREMLSTSTGDKSGTRTPSNEQDDCHDYDEVPVENEAIKRKDHKYEAVKEEQGGLEDYSEPRDDGSPVPPSPSVKPTPHEIVASKAIPQESQPPEPTLVDPTLRPLPSLPGQDTDTTPLDVSKLTERLKKVEAERDQLASAVQLLESRLCEMQKQLNRVIEENAHFRTSVQTPTQESPPASKSSPTSTSEADASMYSIVDKPKRTQSNKFEPKSTGSLKRGSDRGGRSITSVSSEGGVSDDTVNTTDSELFENSTACTTDELQKKQHIPVASGEDTKPKAFSQSTDNGSVKVQSQSTEGGAVKTHSESGAVKTLSESGVVKTHSESGAVKTHSESGAVKTQSESGALKSRSQSTDGELAEGIVQEEQKKKVPSFIDGTLSSQEATDSAVAASGVVSPPALDEVNGYIKVITQNIQELLQAAQAQKQTSLGLCSGKVAKSITQLTRCFSSWCPQAIQASLREIGLASQQLQKVCQDSSQTDVTYQTRLIANCCYDVAKAARHLVMYVEQEQQ